MTNSKKTEPDPPARWVDVRWERCSLVTFEAIDSRPENTLVRGCVGKWLAGLNFNTGVVVLSAIKLTPAGAEALAEDGIVVGGDLS